MGGGAGVFVCRPHPAPISGATQGRSPRKEDVGRRRGHTVHAVVWVPRRVGPDGSVGEGPGAEHILRTIAAVCSGEAGAREPGGVRRRTAERGGRVVREAARYEGSSGGVRCRPSWRSAPRGGRTAPEQTACAQRVRYAAAMGAARNSRQRRHAGGRVAKPPPGAGRELATTQGCHAVPLQQRWATRGAGCGLCFLSGLPGTLRVACFFCRSSIRHGCSWRAACVLAFRTTLASGRDFADGANRGGYNIGFCRVAAGLRGLCWVFTAR